MSNELIHDIEESLRQERVKALWNEYGPYILGGVVIAVVLTGGISGTRHWQNKVHNRDTQILVDALATEDNTADALAKVSTDLHAGPRALAWLTEAGLYLRDDKQDEALAVFEKASADKKLPDLYRDLATLQAVRLSWGLKKGATADKLLARLAPLTEDKKNPWRFHALLQAALINVHDLDDYAAAEDYLTAIASDEKAPQAIRSKAVSLNQLYATPAYRAQKPDAVKTTNKKEEPEG